MCKERKASLSFCGFSCPLIIVSLLFLFTQDGFCSQENWTKDTLLYEENFDSESIDSWKSELQKPDVSVVDIQDGKLNIDVGGGATIWFKHKLEGNVLIEYDVTVIKKGGANDRVSDLNQFWMASDPVNTNLFTRSGNFSQYDNLRLYYVGMGGNNNSTTRFRRYPGSGERPLLAEYTDAEYLLQPNTDYHIEIICFKGLTQFIVNGEVYFNFKDPDPLVEGNFGFRTVRNHETVDNFKVYRLVESKLSTLTKNLNAAGRTVLPGESIQDAIDHVSPNGGGIVTLAAGVHNITSPVQIKSNVTLQGEGNLASTLKTTSDIKMIIQAGYGLMNVTIRNLVLIGSPTKKAGGIHLISYNTDHDGIKLSGVHVFETGWGVHIKGAKNVSIENCNFSRNGNPQSKRYAHNLYLRRCYTVNVSNCIFNNSTSANGINISYSKDINIYNCEAIGNHFRGMRAADTDGFRVHNCVIADNGNVGLLANTEKVVTKNIDWENNCVSNNGGKGIYARSGATGSCKNNNSFGNSDDYDLPDTVSQSGNVSDSSIVSSSRINDYTFSCWQNGWRKNVNDHSADIFGIETSRYGFTLDLADFSKVRFGTLANPVGYEQALAHKAEKLKELPLAQLLIELDVDGISYRAQTCKAGKEKGVKHLQDVRMWESGRYVQHYDFLKLDFRNATGEQLGCDADLDVIAWPASLTFNLNISPVHPCKHAILRLGLKSEAGTWSREEKVEGLWQQDEKKSISMTCRVPVTCPVPSANISVTTENGQRFPVHFDRTKQCYVASVNRLERNWPTGYTDIRHYDEFKIIIDSSNANDLVPFLLDVRPPANITGLCPILCHEDGRPTGIPIQLSKNWHYKPIGSYLVAYAMLPVKETTTYLLRVVYGFYGTLPSASHAQLSLIGYGGHGRWDQLAIGCWGETICFDMDMSLVDVAITDIRMLMTRNGVDGKKWSWTDAGWGGDWLNIRDDSQEKYFQNNLKTAYLSQGPCLTDVKYEGYYGKNQEVDFKARIQTLRTDDYSRTFQSLSYRFTCDVSAQRIWLFKLGRTSHYATPQIAYGNSDGCIENLNVPETLEKKQLFLDKVKLTGSAPWWVALPGAVQTSSRNWGTGYRALIIRDFQAHISGKTFTNPTISAPVFSAGPANLDIEILPPAGITDLSRGDRIALDLELITLPRVADDYYGPNQAFRTHLTENQTSWKTTYREATGNDLAVKVTGGRTTQNYPLVIQVEKPEVTVSIKGGIGAVPMRFEGLKSSVGLRLYRIVNGEPIPFDQSVHGNDFWQTDYNPDQDTWSITYNIKLASEKPTTFLFK